MAIEKVLVNKRAVSPTAEAHLPAGSRSIEIYYAALSFTDPHQNRFKYRLEGWHDDWWDGGKDRRAHFVDLGPGTYRFRVLASNNDGVWNQNGAVFAFTIAPHFWQTMWFNGLCVLAALLLLAGAHRLRVARVRAVYGAVLAERTRVARDLHDKLLQGMTAVAWQIDAGVAQISQAPDKAKRQLNLAQTMLSESQEDARQVVWDLRPDVDDRSDLAAALTTALARLGDGHGMDIAFTVSGTPFPLSHNVENHLFQITKEAVTNALKHSEGKHVRVALQFADSEIRLTIDDDGRGFSGPGPQGHFGLQGLRERAQEISGVVTVDSQPGQGTHVELRVPRGKKIT